jgi:hypothetical protein
VSYHVSRGFFVILIGVQRTAKTAHQQVALATFASSGMGNAFGRGALHAFGMTVYAAPRRLE